MSFVNVFGGTTIYPADVAYRDLPLTANTTLEWPTELASSANILASIMDVTPAGGTHTIRLPAANLASVGETALFFNVGAVNFIIADNGGNTLVTVAPGLAWQVYLTDNVTANGIWRSTQYGAGTSSATAGSLVGAGIKAIGTTLNQSMPSSSLNTNYTVGVGDRAQVLNWTGGAGTFTLPSAATAGADWFFNVRNSGTGSVTISPSVGGQFINGGASLVMNPGDSAVIFCDSAGFFTVGLGKSAAFAFDFVSIDLTAESSPYTLSGANLNRIAYRFTGTITGNMDVIVPATVQQYWFANETSLASAPYTITLKTAAGLGVNLSRNQRAIVYCDGTNVVDADTGGISIPLTIAQGGTGATTESGARINLGGTSTGIAVFTAVSASSARNSLGSGATGDAIFIAANTAAAQAALGTITVPNGGTGATTLTGVVKGNGTSAFTAGTVSLTSEVSGTLPVANGGTGTATAFTAGSVVFAGASGVYSQDNANLFWDDANNRLGIGTASPGAKLDITGNIRLSDAIPNIEFNNGGAMVYAPAGNTLAFATGGGPAAPIERMRLDSAGNLGVGDAAPAYKLTVAGDIRLTGGGDLRVGSATGTTTSGGDSQIYNDANDMIFTTGTTAAERFRIGSVGQWGIGGATYGASGQVFSSQGASAAPTWLTLATVATSGSFADLSNKPGIRSNGQNVITATKTLGAADSGTNILITTSGITITFPATGFASGEGFAISNISGGNVTLSAPGGSDFGATLPDDGSLFVFCDGGGFWRQYCYSTTRL